MYVQLAGLKLTYSIHRKKHWRNTCMDYIRPGGRLLPEDFFDISERYCRMVQRVSTSISMLLTYILTRGMTPGNSSYVRKAKPHAMTPHFFFNITSAPQSQFSSTNCTESTNNIWNVFNKLSQVLSKHRSLQKIMSEFNFNLYYWESSHIKAY